MGVQVKRGVVSMKAKVLLFLSLIIMLFVMSNLFSIYQGKKFEESFDRVLTRYYTINDFMTSFNKNIELYERYLEDKTESNWVNYINNDVQVRARLKEMVADSQALSLNSYLLIQSIKNMYATYSRTIAESYEEGAESAQLKKVYEIFILIDDATKELLQTALTYGFDAYHQLAEDVDTERIMSVSLMIFVVVIAVTFGSFMVENVLNPIKNLSGAARALEREAFDTPDLPVRLEDEMGQLNRAFNRMKRRMEAIICELKEKQVLSERLHEQELRIMNNEKMMEKGKLQFLQSQINPHFLFNTLNVISGMAKLEHAKTTDELILCLSRLFRYNLEIKAEIVTLSQELAVIKSYIFIERKRFGERLSYRLKADADLDLYDIPPFTLQPLVENSIKHGILKRENGGMVAIKVFVQRGWLVIRILDDGVGMEPARRETLLGLRSAENTAGEVSGIGAQNVFERLRMVYPECKLKIISRENRGTCIEIRIPEEDCGHDKAVNCG